jgi:hypothetical protein
VNPGVIITELQKRGGLDEEKYRNFLQHSKVDEANRLEKYDLCADKKEKKIFLITMKFRMDRVQSHIRIMAS